MSCLLEIVTHLNLAGSAAACRGAPGDGAAYRCCTLCSSSSLDDEDELACMASSSSSRLTLKSGKSSALGRRPAATGRRGGGSCGGIRASSSAALPGAEQSLFVSPCSSSASLAHIQDRKKDIPAAASRAAATGSVALASEPCASPAWAWRPMLD